ncbi:POL4 protein, partial [Pseudoatta argentina]
KQFLGLAGYYRRFLPGFSKTARPLTELLKNDAEFRWSDTQEQAFVTLKISLCKEPLLQYPDFTLPFVVTTDASKYAIGGILSQGEIGKDRPIAYTSRLLNSAEQNYSTIEKELNPAVASTDKNAITKTNNHKPLFPLARNENPTQHNRSSDPIPASTTHTKNNLPEQSHDIPEDEFSPANDDTLSESDTDSDESSEDNDPPLCHTPNVPHQRFNVREVPDSFITRKDSLIIFTTQTGELCDLGARILAEQGHLPRIENAVSGRAKVINDKNCYIIVLIIEERTSELITRQTIIDAISVLLSVIDEIGLTSVSICKSDIDRVSWTKTRDIIDETFNNHGVKIAICTNEISIPPISDRLRILREYHDSAAGGHKGITKTYWRIKYRYYWPNMKADIQAYV